MAILAITGLTLTGCHVYFKSRNHQHKVEEKQKNNRKSKEEMKISQEEMQKLKEEAAERIVRESWQREHDAYLRQKEEREKQKNRS